jgi:hypothetical protein
MLAACFFSYLVCPSVTLFGHRSRLVGTLSLFFERTRYLSVGHCYLLVSALPVGYGYASTGSFQRLSQSVPWNVSAHLTTSIFFPFSPRLRLHDHTMLPLVGSPTNVRCRRWSAGTTSFCIFGVLLISIHPSDLCIFSLMVLWTTVFCATFFSLFCAAAVI